MFKLIIHSEVLITDPSAVGIKCNVPTTDMTQLVLEHIESSLNIY